MSGDPANSGVRATLSALAADLVKLRGSPAPDPQPVPAAAAPSALVWDSADDTRWAADDARFARVLHVFHQEWHGIRAAASYAPGHKLAIPNERPLHPEEHAELLQGLASRQIAAVIVHGYSLAADALVTNLRAAAPLPIFAVWHGNTAQLHSDYEVEIFALLLSRRAGGALDGLACVKADLHLVSGSAFPKTLLNLPPHGPDLSPPAPRAAASGIAFLPVPNDWRKNFYSNLLAARLVPRIREVVVTTGFRPLPGPALPRIRRLRRPDREQVFRVMRGADLILNATLSECQPMTALEGLALGTPCLTGPLSLGALDRHPYQRLAQVAGVDSLREVRDAIERILDARERPGGELQAMMLDYSSALTQEALQRYGEFLRL